MLYPIPILLYCAVLYPPRHPASHRLTILFIFCASSNSLWLFLESLLPTSYPSFAKMLWLHGINCARYPIHTYGLWISRSTTNQPSPHSTSSGAYLFYHIFNFIFCFRFANCRRIPSLPSIYEKVWRRNYYFVLSSLPGCAVFIVTNDKGNSFAATFCNTPFVSKYDYDGLSSFFHEIELLLESIDFERNNASP